MGIITGKFHQKIEKLENCRRNCGDKIVSMDQHPNICILMCLFHFKKSHLNPILATLTHFFMCLCIHAISSCESGSKFFCEI